jgi:hypothetical protein
MRRMWIVLDTITIIVITHIHTSNEELWWLSTRDPVTLCEAGSEIGLRRASYTGGRGNRGSRMHFDPHSIIQRPRSCGTNDLDLLPA